MIFKVIKKILSKSIKQGIIARIIEELMKNSNVKFEQIMSLLFHEAKLAPLPPEHLQVRVVGGFFSDFVDSGYRVHDELNIALKPIGKTLKDFPFILDFGCGCGRNIRAMKDRLPQNNFFGTDIDDEAINWLEKNYKRYGEFNTNPHWPPTIYKENQFDFIYVISIFTHVPEDMQFAWLEELRRISKPGSYLILTTHGKKHYGKFRKKKLEIMNNKGFYYEDTKKVHTQGLPGFYQNSYHSHKYIRREWSKYFNIVDIIELGLDNHQDMILLQNII